MHIAHIVNPVKVGESSDLFVAQPVTFESMLRAKRYAEKDKGLTIDLFTTQYSEDRAIIPDGFKIAPDLIRSVLDEQPFDPPRKLPFLHDILEILRDNAPEADYLVYTNADIALMPQFYKSVSVLAGLGHDAFVINRRTIPKTYSRTDELPLMYMFAGEPHPGFDCFVFKRDLWKKLDLGRVILGARWVGRVFVLNLIAASDSFVCFSDLHLTFHLGNDKTWAGSKYKQYDEWNTRELLDTIQKLESNQKIRDNVLAQRLIQKSLNVDTSTRSQGGKLIPRLINLIPDRLRNPKS